MKRKCIAILFLTLLLTGCASKSTSPLSSMEYPKTVTVTDPNCSYYNKTEDIYKNVDQDYVVTTETLFNCPARGDSDFGCFEIMRDGESGNLIGNYEIEEKGYRMDKCFATFTDLDTGNVYYQLVREYTNEPILDANQIYVVVPQDVFDKLVEENT